MSIDGSHAHDATTTALAALKLRLDNLTERVTALESTPPPPPVEPPPPPPVEPPPPSGIPVIPAAYGKTLRKVFSDGTLAPFRVLTYPDAHPNDLMEWRNRFANGSKQVSVHDGYADLRSTPRAGSNLFDSVLLGTAQDGNGPMYGYGVFRYWLRFNVDPGSWPAAWLFDTTFRSATEIDFPEPLQNEQLTAHVLGQGAGAKYGIPKPADIASAFHEYRVERRAGFVAFAIDGTEVARISNAMPSTPLAILLDCKVGLKWTGIEPVTPGFLHVAAVTVDP